MGKLFYDGDAVLDVPDRTLVHVQLAILQKLRRQEQFMLTWHDDPAANDGYNSIWLSPSIPLRFRFDARPTLPVNRAWVDAMVAKASNNGNLTVMSDPDEPVTGAVLADGPAAR